jgi:hypothetical protein
MLQSTPAGYYLLLCTTLQALQGTTYSYQYCNTLALHNLLRLSPPSCLLPPHQWSRAQ